MNGKVSRIIVDKGFGFIRGEDNKEYFFHRSGIKNIEFEALMEGQAVQFKDEKGQKGPRAEEIYV